MDIKEELRGIEDHLKSTYEISKMYYEECLGNECLYFAANGTKDWLFNISIHKPSEGTYAPTEYLVFMDGNKKSGGYQGFGYPDIYKQGNHSIMDNILEYHGAKKLTSVQESLF